MFRRYQKCCCMNNNCQDENMSDMLETKCCKVQSYENEFDSCGCGFDEEKNIFPSNPMLAQSYVPIQYMDKTFKPCVGLKMGTIFPELVSPYMPCQDMEEMKYIEATNTIGKGCNQ